MIDKEFLVEKVNLITRDIKRLRVDVYKTVGEAINQYVKYCDYILEYLK